MRAAAAAAALALGVVAALLLLPARLAFTPGDRYQPLLRSARLVPGGDGFAAGTALQAALPAPDPDASTLALRVRLRRASNPVRVVVERDRLPIASAWIAASPSWIEVPLEPGTTQVRLLAEAERDAFATLYLIERVELRRRFGARRAALIVLPGLLGAGVTGLLPASPLVAGLWGVHAAAAAAAGLAHTLDTPAALQFSGEAWSRSGWGLALSMAALLLVPRLMRQPEATGPGPRLRPRHVVAAALAAAAVLLAGAALVVSSRVALLALFGEASLNDIDVVQRAGVCRQILLGAAGATLYLGLFSLTVVRLDRLRENGVNASMFTLLTLALLGATEGVLAPRYRPVYWPADPNVRARAERATYLGDPELGHVLNPDSDRPYVINGAGLRGAEVPARKAPGEWRIATLGDSIPFGIDLPEDAPFGVQLERLLAARASPQRSYRVLNAGVPAYGSLQACRALRRVVLPLQPEVVIVSVGWNDLSWAMGSGWHPERSIAYRWQPQRFRPAIVRFAEEASAPRTVRLGEPDPRAVQAFRANLETLIAEARTKEVRVLLTNMPTILSALGNSEEERRIALGKLRIDWKIEHVRLFDSQIEAVCREHREIGCARDLFPLEEQGKGSYFRDHCHPNAEGHALIALKLLRTLERLGWL